MNILLTGYYGHQNIGDEIFLKFLLEYFLSKDFIRNIRVLCDESHYPQYHHPKISFWLNQKTSKFKKIQLILQSNITLWGGGTLNFKEPPKNLLRMQNMAHLFKGKFGFIGIGLESLKAETVLPEVIKLYQNSDILCLRDYSSYEIATQRCTGSPKQSLTLGGDLAFLDLSFYQPFVKTEKTSQIKNISFSGKHWWGKVKVYAPLFQELYEKHQIKTHFLPGNLGEGTNDNKFHQKLKDALPEDSCIIQTWETPQDFLKILSQMDFHIGNRLHSVILADILGIPNIGIDQLYSKISNYLQKTGQFTPSRLVDIGQPIPVETIQEVWQNYQRPTAFIQEESQRIRNCLDAIFII